MTRDRCSDYHKRRNILFYLLSEVETETEIGLFEELWQYFDEKYFTPDIPRLENISFGTGTLVTLKIILIGFTVGLILASFITLYNKRFIGGFIRKLIREGCIGPQNAKGLSELGYEKNILIRFSLRSGSPLSRWARCSEEDEFYIEIEKKREEFEEAHKDEKKPPKFKEITFKRNVKTMHFYIPEEKEYSADIKFDAKGANWLSFVFVVIVSIALCIFLCYTLPDLIKMIDNFISVMKR